MFLVLLLVFVLAATMVGFEFGTFSLTTKLGTKKPFNFPVEGAILTVAEKRGRRGSIETRKLQVFVCQKCTRLFVEKLFEFRRMAPSSQTKPGSVAAVSGIPGHTDDCADLRVTPSK